MKTYYQKNREKILAKAKQYHVKHRERHNAYKREYDRTHREQQAAYYARWYKENGRNRADDHVEKALEWQQDHPERVKIHKQLNYAVNSGKIKRPEVCPKCGRKTLIHAHHIDYKHYTHFVWLCASCHKIEHNKGNIS